MNKDILYIVQLESYPYLIKGKSKEIKYYCCKGKIIKGHSILNNKKLFIHFNVNSFEWSQSSIPLVGYRVMEKVKNLSDFLNKIKQANSATQFLINGKNINYT